MSFGIQIFDANGKDIVDKSRNVFIEEFVAVNGNGSRNYNLGPGERLNAFVLPLENRDTGTHYAVSNLTISGNSVSWSAVYGSSLPFYICIVREGAL